MKKLLLPLLVAVGLIGSASATVLTGDLTNGLVAYYSLNGNANDSSGNGNNGSAVNTTYTINRFGENQSAAFFSSEDNNYIKVSSLQNLPYAPITYSIWYKIDKFNDIDGNTLIGRAGGANSSGGAVAFYPYATHGIDIYYSTGWGGFFTGITTASNTWNNLIISCDYYNWGFYLISYLNGELIKNERWDGAGLGSYNTPFVIGNNANYSNSFNGSISDVGIWNRALTSTEVSQLYAIQSVPEPSTCALFGIGAIGMLMVMRRKKTA